jgi:WXG100 family type VII secretion target
MADTTQLDYDQMANIIKMFQSEQQELLNLLKQTDSKVEGLHGSEWIGKGADEFFNEMKGDVLPAVQRLTERLAPQEKPHRKLSRLFDPRTKRPRAFSVILAPKGDRQ